MAGTTLVSRTSQSDTTKHKNFEDAWSQVSDVVREIVGEGSAEIEVSRGVGWVSIRVIGR